MEVNEIDRLASSCSNIKTSEWNSKHNGKQCIKDWCHIVVFLFCFARNSETKWRVACFIHRLAFVCHRIIIWLIVFVGFTLTNRRRWVWRASPSIGSLNRLVYWIGWSFLGGGVYLLLFHSDWVGFWSKLNSNLLLELDFYLHWLVWLGLAWLDLDWIGLDWIGDWIWIFI